MLAFVINTAEHAPIPNGISHAAIDMLRVRVKRRLTSTTDNVEKAFVVAMDEFRVGSHLEMFEHISNGRALLHRIHGWTRPDDKLFLHVFTNKIRSNRFDRANSADWVPNPFLTGAIMAADYLQHRSGDLFNVEQEWRRSGLHYRRTALDWLASFDRRLERIGPILNRVYGSNDAIWQRPGRLFFFSTAELFDHDAGYLWDLGHYSKAPIR